MASRESIATSLLVLKALAKNPDADYPEIAKQTDKPENIVAEIVKEYVSVYLSQETEPDFPASLIAQYKDKSGNDLSMEDFEGLMPLVDEFRHGGEDEKNDDNGERPKAENLKSRGTPKAGSRMSLPRNNRYDNNNNPGGSQTTQNDLPDLSSNSALMKWVLERTPRAGSQPKAIQHFLEMFELQENLLIREPQRLLQHLIFGFGELPGQSAFSNFMNLRPQFVYDTNPSQTIYNQAGLAGMGQPGGMGMGMGGGMGYGQPQNPLLNNPQYQQMMMDEQMEDIRDRREERKDRQDERKEAAVQRRMYVQQMANMVQSQTPMNPMMMGQMGGMGMGTGGAPMAFKEVVDKDGKPVSREWYPRAPGSSPSGDDSTSKLMFDMLKEANKDNKDMTTKMFDTFHKNNNLSDVIKTIKEVKELGSDVFGDRRGGTETPETLELRMDMAKTVMGGKMELRKLQHEWQREREDRISSQETMKGWFDGISGIVNGATQTVLPEFMRGIGMAAGKHRMAQQAQMGGQQQQAAASYQQQQAMQAQQQQQVRQQQMAAQQAAAAQAQNNNPNPNMYQQGGMSFAPQQYSAPAPQQQQQQQRQPAPQPDRMTEVMRQHELSDQDFFDASDDDLDMMAKQFEHGVRQLGSMHNRIDEERSRRRHTKQRKQASKVITERDQQKDSEAAARARATAPAPVYSEPPPQPHPVVREEPPAAAPEPEPQPVKAAQPQVERPPHPEPEPASETNEAAGDDTEEDEDDDGEDEGPET